RARRRPPGEAQVAAEVDAGAGRPGGEKPGHDEVGGQAFADAAGVEADAGREADPVAVDADPGGAAGERAGRLPAGRAAVVEAAVVAGPDDRPEDGGVEAADRQ